MCVGWDSSAVFTAECLIAQIGSGVETVDGLSTSIQQCGVVIGHFSDGEKERAMRSERPRLG